MRDRAALYGAQPASPAAFQEFEAQPALAGAGIGDDAHDASRALDGAFERRFERRHVPVATDEA